MDSVIDTGPPPPCPAPYNLAADVLAAGAGASGKPALEIVAPGRATRLGFGELIGAVRGVSGALADRGLASGDRVLLRLGNSAEFPIAFLAAAAADLVPVVVSSQLTAPEIAAVLADIRPALVIADPALPMPEAPGCPVLPAGALAALHDAAPRDPVPGDPDRPGYIVFTSGTAGRPRAVVHAHRAIFARRMMREGWYGLRPDDRVLHAGAFNWTFTLGTGLLDPWSVGATALVPEPRTPPAALPGLIVDHGATIFAAAPGVYRQMLGAGAPVAAPRLRHGLSAGEKLSDGIRTAWETATGTPVHEAYGLSECSTFVSGSPARPAPAGTLGYAQPGRRIAILDDAGRIVPRGTVGVLAVSQGDPGLMLGYHGAPDETRARFQDGWFLTGDRAAIGTDGAVTYLGRADDMMNAGGYRVSPIEVEGVLAGFPGVLDCAVTEVRVKADATVIAAFYSSATPLDEARLNAHMSGRLARYKTPRLYVRVAELPRNPNGKLSRRALRDDWESRHGQA